MQGVGAGESAREKRKRKGSVHTDSGSRRKGDGRKRDDGRVNPFAIKDGSIRANKKTRIDVGGTRKRVKRGQSSRSRAAEGDDARRGLHEEYKRRWKAGGILDRRISAGGKRKTKFTLYEEDEDFGPQTANGNEDGSFFGGMEHRLTHLGRSLDDEDAYSDQDNLFDDDDTLETADAEKKLKRELTRDFNFGGFEEVHEKHSGIENDAEQEYAQNKSKKEIYEEIIAKSKKYKAERQLAKAEDEEQLAALDVEFNSYTGNTELKFLEQLSSFQINSGKRQERKRNDSRSKQKSAGSIDIGDVEDQQKILAKQFHTKSAMIIDTKKSDFAAATDRMLTESELNSLRESKNVAEERDRERRMAIPEYDAENVVVEDDENFPGGYKGRRMLQKAQDRLEKNVDGLKRKKNEESEDDDDDDDEDDDENSDGDSEEAVPKKFTDIVKSVTDHSNIIKVRDHERNEEIPSESDEDKYDTGNLDNQDKETGDAKHKMDHIASLKPEIKNDSSVSPVAQDVHFPKTYGEFRSVLDGCDSDSSRSITIKEIVSSALSNKRPRNETNSDNSRWKVQQIYSFTVQYLVDNILAYGSRSSGSVDFCFYHLYELTSMVPLYAGNVALERLNRMHCNLTSQLAKIKGFVTRDKGVSSISTWPRSYEVALLRLWTILFPTSDYKHPVVNPMVMLICHHLSYSPLTRTSDIAVGILLCTLCASIVSKTKRYMSEPILFLSSIMALFVTNNENVKQGEEEFGVDVELSLNQLQQTLPWLSAQHWMKGIKWNGSIDSKISNGERGSQMGIPIEFILDIQRNEDICESEDGKVHATFIFSTVKCVSRFMVLYSELPSFREIFRPVVSLVKTLKRVQEKNMSKTIGVESRLLLNALDECLLSSDLAKTKGRSTTPEGLTRGQQPIPSHDKAGALDQQKGIVQFAPKFEDDFELGKDYDLDIERVEHRRLKKQLKKEHKGAVKELRKDNTFLAQLKAKEEQEERLEQRDKGKKALKFLQSVETDIKSGGQGGSKLKKRK